MTAGRGPRLGASIKLCEQANLREDTVGEVLSSLAVGDAEGAALMSLHQDGQETMTWSELYGKSCGVAAALLDINPARGRVAIVSFNSVDWILAMFGCALAGMPVVPIAPSATDREAEHLLAAAHTQVVLAVESANGLDVVERVRAVARRLPLVPVVHHLAHVASATSGPCPGIPVDAADEFLLQFTSGTTGLARPAVLSHRAAINCADNFAQACRARAGDRWYNPLPLYHVGGSVAGVITTLACGATFIVTDRFTPEDALRVFRQVQPALVGMVPTMLIDLLAMDGVSTADFASVKTIIGGATAVDPALVEQVERKFGINFTVSYGQSESPILTCSHPEDSVRVRTQTLGHCLPGRDYSVRDSGGRIVPTGQLGELSVRGPLNMSGYLLDDGTLDANVDADGWLRTGDVCTMGDDGVLEFEAG